MREWLWGKWDEQSNNTILPSFRLWRRQRFSSTKISKTFSKTFSIILLKWPPDLINSLRIYPWPNAKWFGCKVDLCIPSTTGELLPPNLRSLPFVVLAQLFNLLRQSVAFMPSSALLWASGRHTPTRAELMNHCTDLRYKSTVLDPNFVKKVGTFFGSRTQLKCTK